jgi:hypothetical protein
MKYNMQELHMEFLCANLIESDHLEAWEGDKSSIELDPRERGHEFVKGINLLRIITIHNFW